MCGGGRVNAVFVFGGFSATVARAVVITLHRSVLQLDSLKKKIVGFRVINFDFVKGIVRFQR